MLSLVTIAGGAMFGAGAFTQVQADRTVTAGTAGDGSAYLQLQGNSSYVAENTDDEIEFTLDNLNGNATTTINYAFNVSVNDQTDGTYAISIDDSEGIGEGAAMEFKAGDTSLTGSSVSVSSGGTAEVDIVVNLRDNPDSDLPDSITIVADEE